MEGECYRKSADEWNRPTQPWDPAAPGREPAEERIMTKTVQTWQRARRPHQIEERREAILDAAAGLLDEVGLSDRTSDFGDAAG